MLMFIFRLENSTLWSALQFKHEYMWKFILVDTRTLGVYGPIIRAPLVGLGDSSGPLPSQVGPFTMGFFLDPILIEFENTAFFYNHKLVIYNS